MPENLQPEAENTPLIGSEAAEPTEAVAPAEAAPAEVKTDEVKTDEVAPEDVKEEAEKVPEAYEDFKVPEGVELAESVASEVKSVAKELGLTQSKAQLLIDKLGPQVAKANTEAFNAQVAKVRDAWTEASKTDKEFGGENLDKNLGGANQVLKTYGTPALRQLLVDSGLSQHPEIIRFMVRVRKDVSEDKFVSGKESTGARPTGFVYSKSNFT